ncbi:MAG TPA: hypothetical protein VFB14_06180 [Bryobacteraceae bacterium]|jgi:hypothetical protein|nr:hypothetical protein [Bryobacteraceae bacterium]
MSLKPFKYSLPSRKLTRSDQDAASLDALKAELRAEHQPANTTEEMLVNEIAEQFWRLRRARAFEANLLDGSDFIIPHVDAVQRIAASAERGLHKALAALRRLQKDRGFVPQKEQSGSVPQKQNRDRQGAAELAAPSGFVSQKPEPALQHSA